MVVTSSFMAALVASWLMRASSLSSRSSSTTQHRRGPGLVLPKNRSTVFQICWAVSSWCSPATISCMSSGSSWSVLSPSSMCLSDSAAVSAPSERSPGPTSSMSSAHVRALGFFSPSSGSTFAMYFLNTGLGVTRYTWSARRLSRSRNSKNAMRCSNTEVLPLPATPRTSIAGTFSWRMTAFCSF